MMSNEKWVQTVIWVVVFLNLVVISRVFLIPRGDFIVSHIEEDQEGLLQSSGPLDMPNQYVHTYRLMISLSEPVMPSWWPMSVQLVGLRGNSALPRPAIVW